MLSVIRRLSAVLSLSLVFFISQAQPVTDPTDAIKKENKPYKVLTSGKQITIKSSREIKHVMLWTTGGDRVVEQKDVNNTTISIDIPISRKAFFLMIGLANGKVYTEKIGIQ
ncbi:MAG TPA: hypothetical protein VMZ03_12480 [Chitinophagaceae bacterium]|nr:hypothetical protein [Chitinophagaceae bacterium]